MSDWKYLYSKPFQVRGAIAAHYLKDYKNIIEIVGHKSPIADFLTHDFDHVVSIDPLIEPRSDEKVLPYPG